MKVLHVIPSLSRLRGGPTFVLKTLAAHQARAGADVHVATTDDDDFGRRNVPVGTPVPADGVTYWYFARTTRTYQSSLGLTRWLLHRTAEFDLVHIHSVFTFPATAAAKIARLRRVPYVVRPLGVLNRWGLASGHAWAKRLSVRLIEGGILRQAAAIQYSTDAERAESQQTLPLGRAVVIPNPVDLAPPAPRGQFRARCPFVENRRIVLFIGRLAPVKGIEPLLDAFAIVRRNHPRAALVIAGANDELYVRALRARAKALDIANQVLWTGYLDHAGKAAALADADVFVAPSQSESFGLAAVEALAAGAPSVLSRGVGIASEALAAEAALVVPPDAPSMADAIAGILNDRTLAFQLANRARAFVETRYGPDAVAAQTMRLYTEIGCRS
ncbi:MAG TPA: glycosyltransferase [Bryobacteraceae bacterium]|nr:glycosyltransferase [Bryobacteraceae bacterium]